MNPIPVSLGDFKKVELLVDAGIAHQDVDATKRFDSFLDHGVDMTETAHICLHEESTSVVRADLLRGLLSRGLVDLGDNDMRTLLGVTQGDGFPNADPATGNDGDFVFQ